MVCVDVSSTITWKRQAYAHTGMYNCLHLCTYVRRSACTYECMYVCMCVYMNARVCVYVHVCTRICMYVRMCVSVCSTCSYDHKTRLSPLTSFLLLLLFHPSHPVLLLLPLIGNGSAERSAELPLVQHKLRENRVRYKALIDLFNKQADDQERLQKVRRKRDAEKRAELERELEMEMERERELEEERERERELDADSEMLTEKRIENLEGSEVESVIQTEDVLSDNLTDFSDWPTVLSPIRTPPEYDSDGSARMSPPVPNSVPSLSPVMSSRPLSTQSVQFSPLTSIIPPMSLDWTADDGSFTTSPGSPNLGNGDSAPVALGSQSSEESANMLITFGTFPAVSISSSPAPRTPSSDGGLIAPSPFKSVPPSTLLPLPLPLSLPPLLPLLTIPSCGIADVQSPPGLNSTLTYTEPSHIRRASSLLMRPKSMGHILDQQLNARLMQATSPTVGSLRRVKKEKNVLNVLFSAPLAWRDRSNRLHPLEMLDYGAERSVSPSSSDSLSFFS